MASGYEVTAWLVDRAYIEDTVTRMSMYLDMKNFTGLTNEVFAARVFVDYTDSLEFSSRDITGREQAKTWEGQAQFFSSHQHTLQGILINLPHPGTASTPNEAVVMANTTVTLRRDSPSGDSLARSGSLYELKLTRSGSAQGNPWRISSLKSTRLWVSDNVDLVRQVAM